MRTATTERNEWETSPNDTLHDVMQQHVENPSVDGTFQASGHLKSGRDLRHLHGNRT